MVDLERPFMLADGNPAIIVCPACGATGSGEPPHGWREPCPSKVAVDEAYIAMLDAQRMAHIRSASGVESIAGSFGRMAGDDD